MTKPFGFVAKQRGTEHEGMEGLYGPEVNWLE